jgi:hypothetical protein
MEEVRIENEVNNFFKKIIKSQIILINQKEG